MGTGERAMKVPAPVRAMVLRPVRAARRLWRRSLQIRVIASTVVLCGVVVVLAGWALLDNIAHGLAENRRDAAIAQARTGYNTAQARLDAAVESPGDSTQSASLTQLVDSLTAASPKSRVYDMVLEGPLNASGHGPVRTSTELAKGTVPDDLQHAVVSGRGTYWRYSELPLAGGSQSDDQAGVVVGSTVTSPSSGDRYAMYYLFSMAEQQATLALVRKALIIAGFAMVALVGAIAWLVTRQVLNPIRSARSTAERLAQGSLEERMQIQGEDDLARLASSFNQMAASLQQQIRQLQELSRLQQRFVSDVSHELRTPLTTVQMAAEVLGRSKSQLDAQSARAAELLRRELKRFEDLLRDLLDLSRFDAGAAGLQLAKVDMAAVARRAAGNPQLARASIAVELSGADRPAVVDADIRRVERIIRNLLNNVAKYSGSQRVRVTVAAATECVSISVRDWGRGLDQGETERVFDRFWRSDPARTQGGTGLGLSISREDALLQRGTLTAWGAPGRGAEFILTIPRLGGSADPPAIISEFA